METIDNAIERGVELLGSLNNAYHPQQPPPSSRQNDTGNSYYMLKDS